MIVPLTSLESELNGWSKVWSWGNKAKLWGQQYKIQLKSQSWNLTRNPHVLPSQQTSSRENLASFL